MANRYSTPVMFAMEKNVTFLYAQVLFDASGACSLVANNSKGICSVNPQSVVFTGATTASVTSVGTVSSFAGLFTGMTVTGAGIQGSTTIGTISASTDSLVLSKVASITGTSSSLIASGGRYVFQFGTQAGVKLDTYVKLLSVQTKWDESTASASGSATLAALAPEIGTDFVVSNNISVRTIPSTATTSSTDASISLQFGTGTGVNFVAKNPAAGESLRVCFTLCNSTAM